jgi:flavin reductase (DIM6/NTAB) family NADH-FMN oxidoreductase RutF
LLLGGVLPRPIALVSTISTDGIKNLAPFSFFNVFGANPPIIAFSASRRGRDGTFKDTYNNLVATRECVVQAVTYEMVEQINTASKEFPPSEDEFVLSGLTPIPSKLVAPHRVKESPFQMECKLHQMINLGDGNAAGNLAICEVVLFHIAQHILDDGQINPFKYDAVARLGGDYYTRVTAGSIFELAKPVSPNPKN